MRRLLREWHHLQFDEEGILQRKIMTKTQLVVPENLKRMIYKYLHEDMALLGADRMVAAARARFFWLRMREEIEHFVTRVCRCLRRSQIGSLEPQSTALRQRPHLNSFRGSWGIWLQLQRQSRSVCSI